MLGPVAAAIVHALLSPKREFEADQLAAIYCESPHGLADGLIRLEQAAELLSRLQEIVGSGQRLLAGPEENLIAVDPTVGPGHDRLEGNPDVADRRLEVTLKGGPVGRSLAPATPASVARRIPSAVVACAATSRPAEWDSSTSARSSSNENVGTCLPPRPRP